MLGIYLDGALWESLYQSYFPSIAFQEDLLHDLYIYIERIIYILYICNIYIYIYIYIFPEVGKNNN